MTQDIKQAAFKHIALAAHPRYPDAAKQVLDGLAQLGGIQVTLDEDLARRFNIRSYPMASKAALVKDADLLVIVGGDGSLLAHARLAADHDVPLLGVNVGRLGFLADLTLGDVEGLRQIIQGYYCAEERVLLHSKIMHHQRLVFESVALNEVLLMRHDHLRMIDFEINIDGCFVCSQRADGLIVSTPTGSTAYALSAGGPIIHPSIPAMALVPLCAHTLTSKPLLIHQQSSVDLILTDRHQREAKVFADGGFIQIRQYDRSLKLIHPLNYRYFETLKHKLHWEQKSYASPAAVSQLHPRPDVGYDVSS